MQGTTIFRLMESGDNAAEEVYKYANDCTSKQERINQALKQYIPQLHDVASKAKRPDKPTFVPVGVDKVTGATVYGPGTSPVTRAPLALQKYIISQKASFARGNGILLKPTIENSTVFGRVYDNWRAVKANFDLKEIATRQMAETQVAVIFFGEKGKETLDDFNFKYKIVSPLKGDVLTPFFDDDDDSLLSFARAYTRISNLGKEIKIYDLYLMNPTTGLCEIWRYVNGKPKIISTYTTDGKLEGEQHEVIKTPYIKLPIVYWDQEAGECDDTEAIMVEMETGFSDFLTQLGYSADPILFAKGKTMDLPAKGQAGKFIETDDPAGDLKFVTPDNATEARELQFKLLQKFIFSLNRAVLLDMETLRGLGAISGAALERYLIDCYMEATDKQQGSWGKGIQRMVNWLKAHWELLETKEPGLHIDVQFTKYSLQDELERVTLAITANGGKPVIDLETSIGIADLVDDVNGTFNKIKEETVIPAAGSATDIIVE